MQSEQLARTCESRDCFETATTVELMTVSSILDCESGCTTKHAIDKGSGIVPVSILCKGVLFCRKRVVIRTNSDHAVSVLSKAVWQAGTQNILELALKHFVGQQEYLVQRQDQRLCDRVSKGRACGGEVVERMDQVSGEKLDRTQRKIEERRRVPETVKRRGGKNISSRMSTEYTLTDPNSADFRSTGGTQRQKTWLASSGQRCRNIITVLEARGLEAGRQCSNAHGRDSQSQVQRER